MGQYVGLSVQPIGPRLDLAACRSDDNGEVPWLSDADFSLVPEETPSLPEADYTLVPPATTDPFIRLIDHWAVEGGHGHHPVPATMSRGLGQFPIAQLCTLLIKAYLRARLDDGLTVEAVRQHLKLLRAVLEHGIEAGVLDHSAADFDPATITADALQ